MRILALVFVCAALLFAWPASAIAQSEDMGSLLARVEILYDQGKYEEAIPLAERALELTEKEVTFDHTDVAPALLWLGYVYGAAGRYAEAESPLKRALAIEEKALDPDFQVITATLTTLVGLYIRQEHYAKARKLLKPVEEYAMKVSTFDNSEEFASSKTNLADSYLSLSLYTKAEELLVSALEMAEKSPRQGYSDIARTHSRLGQVYYFQGRYGEAEQHFNRAIEIAEKASHTAALAIDLANHLTGLGAVYYAQWRFTEAEPHIKRALEIHEKFFGLGQVDLTMSMSGAVPAPIMLLALAIILSAIFCASQRGHDEYLRIAE